MAACLFAAPAFGTEPATFLPAIDAYSEERPPYNYSEGGQIKGLSADILRAACLEAAMRCQLRSLPWARAYLTVKRQPNSLLYTAVRSPERERQFLWLGPVLPRNTWLWGRAGAKNVPRDRQSLARYRYGVVRGEWAASDLKSAGVPTKAMVEEATKAAALRLLLGGWVDATVDTELGMAWNLHQNHRRADSVVKLLSLSGDSDYYFALHPDTDPRVVERLQAAITKMRKSGQIDALLRNYAISAD